MWFKSGSPEPSISLLLLSLHQILAVKPTNQKVAYVTAAAARGAKIKEGCCLFQDGRKITEVILG